MRPEGWEDRLLEEVERHGDLPFEYGVSDCITFAVDCAKAITGTDVMEHRRNYENQIGAAKALRREGFNDVGDFLASEFEEIPPALAGRGDLGVIEGDEATVAVVFVGAHVVGKEQPGGVRQVSRSLVSRAFRV
jgi:hypothetical protein